MNKLTLVKKIEIGTGREIQRHLEIGDTRKAINKMPSETFNGISAYWRAELIKPYHKKTLWFKEFDLEKVDKFGCIYKGAIEPGSSQS